jgi:hypothetical protein
MNKIKFLYDVVKIMKGKDLFKGVASAQVQKDQETIFYVKNEFQKNLLTCETKANITTEVDYEGKRVKHQSTTEFTNICSGHGMHHRLRHMRHADSKCGGIKEKLTKLAFLLSLLNNVQFNEQEDKTTLITLEVTEIPEDIKALIHEKMSPANSCHTDDRHCFMKEFCSIEKGDLSIAISINKDYEMEKIVVAFDGAQNNEHVLNIIGELQLIY